MVCFARLGGFYRGSMNTREASFRHVTGRAARVLIVDDEEGLLAVGTVVMNRLDAPAYPGRICEVVGQKRQFAPGVLTKPVREADRPRIERIANV